MVTPLLSPLGLALPATYVRQSSARANKSEASPEDQRAATAARATHDHPHAAVLKFEDIGKSGWDPEVKRDGYDALMAACYAGQVTHVYVYYMSRLTRDDPQQVLIDWLPLLKVGITIVSTTEGTFGTGDLGQFIGLIIKLSEGHSQSQTKSVAVKGAKAVAYAAGGHVGLVPYGFATEERMVASASGRPVAIRFPVVKWSEARWLRMAARAVTWGFSTHAVCRYFDRRGVLTRGAEIGRSRAGSAWSARMLGVRLMDPRLAGLPAVAIVTAAGAILGYTVATGVEGERVLPAPDEAILSTDQFWALQAALNSRSRRPARPGDRPALLSRLGVLFCECGRSMKARRYSGRHDNDCYTCTAPAGRHGCTVSMPTLDAYVRFRIGRLIDSIDPADPNQEAALILAEAARRYTRAHADPATASRRAAVAAELADATAQLDRLGETLATATGAAARVLERQVVASGARVDALMGAMAELDEATSISVPLLGWTSGEYGDEGSWWDRAPFEDRREFVSQVLDRITVRRADAMGGKPKRDDPWGLVAARVTIGWAKPKE